MNDFTPPPAEPSPNAYSRPLNVSIYRSMPEHLLSETRYEAFQDSKNMSLMLARVVWLSRVTFAFAVGRIHPGREGIVHLLRLELLPLTAEDNARGLIPSGGANSRAPRSGPFVTEGLGGVDQAFFKEIQPLFSAQIQALHTLPHALPHASFTVLDGAGDLSSTSTAPGISAVAQLQLTGTILSSTSPLQTQTASFTGAPFEIPASLNLRESYDIYYGTGQVRTQLYPALEATWTQLVPGGNGVSFWKRYLKSQRTLMSKLKTVVKEADKWVKAGTCEYRTFRLDTRVVYVRSHTQSPGVSHRERTECIVRGAVHAELFLLAVAAWSVSDPHRWGEEVLDEEHVRSTEQTGPTDWIRRVQAQDC